MKEADDTPAASGSLKTPGLQSSLDSEELEMEVTFGVNANAKAESRRSSLISLDK